jgi:hypothetical protein
MDTSDTRIFASLGEVVVKWNRAENSLRQIAVGACKPSPEIWILTAELGGVSLESALKSLARDVLPSSLAAHVIDVVEWFSRLREYRNYYVHGIYEVRANESGEKIGFISQTTAKNGIVLHVETISEREILTLSQKIDEFIGYASDVEFHVSAHPLTEFSGGTPFPPLPQKPQLPDRLQKPRQRLTDD